jgi:multidrug efflux pump subunit AcrB
MNENSALKDVEDNDPEGIKEIQLTLKDDAYLLGLDLNTVMTQVRSGFFGSQALRFQRGQDEIRVWVRYLRENRSSLLDLDQMRILTPNGQRVPLKEIADYTIRRGEVAINHLDGQREIQINADLDNPEETTATDVLAWIQSEIMPDIVSRYPSVQPSYEGQNREASKLIDSLRLVGFTALFLIFVTIAFNFRSFSQPLLLLIMVPFSLTAVGWGHKIHGFPLNIISLLGIIALIGIMVNDGLVLIGKFNQNLRSGMKYEKALYEAGRARFRAIFLTSLTTIAGLAPLLLEKSRQAQFLKPMAVSISYGIGFATLLTLLMLPLFLSFGNQVKVFFKWLFTGEWVERRTVERSYKEMQNEEV